MHLRPFLASLLTVLSASVSVTALVCNDGCEEFKSAIFDYYIQNPDSPTYKQMNIISFAASCCAPYFDFNKFQAQSLGVTLTAEDGICRCVDIVGVDHFNGGKKLNDDIGSFILLGDENVFNAQFYGDGECASGTEAGRKCTSLMHTKETVFLYELLLTSRSDQQCIWRRLHHDGLCSRQC